MAAQEAMSIPFCIQRKEPVLVKPSQPIPYHNLSLSKMDNFPILERFRHILYVYSPKGVLDSNSSDDPVSVFKQGLARCLVFYYPLAGKINRQPDRTLCISTLKSEDVGVPFLEATVMDCDLKSLNYMDGDDIWMFATEFIFNQPINQEEPYHPLRFQLTMFPCGGFIIGISMLHSVCDGFGTAQFYQALAELMGGKVQPSVIPVWDRESLAILNMPVQEEEDVESHTTVVLPSTVENNNNNESETIIISEFINISSDAIKRLKLKLATEMGEELVSSSQTQITTFEALSGFIWRSRFKALELNPDDKTIFVMMIGLRNWLDPKKSLPKGYYGNAVTIASPVFVKGRDLVDGPLSKIVMLIKESKNKSTQPEFIRSSLSLSEKSLRDHVKLIFTNRSGGATVLVSDWRQLGLPEKEDFGWGGCVNVVPVVHAYNSMAKNTCLFLPPLTLDHSMKGGVKIFLGLPKPAMDKFKLELSALHNLS